MLGRVISSDTFKVRYLPLLCFALYLKPFSQEIHATFIFWVRIGIGPGNSLGVQRHCSFVGCSPGASGGKLHGHARRVPTARALTGRSDSPRGPPAASGQSEQMGVNDLLSVRTVRKSVTTQCLWNKRHLQIHCTERFLIVKFNWRLWVTKSGITNKHNKLGRLTRSFPGTHCTKPQSQPPRWILNHF